ncbi:hypothetical protein GWI33_006859 [Rhynchophorus ferrugineus]|uniref:Uncharacterized protein n=1 Tax=Rhynchophorus ferrugineus TaxID=354439 RepID=A0A834IFB8_RHYFE|nr:hypothetical protein GWI33_006859 [Rhynchophorus ferrugineus]
MRMWLMAGEKSNVDRDLSPATVGGNTRIYIESALVSDGEVKVKFSPSGPWLLLTRSVTSPRSSIFELVDDPRYSFATTRHAVAGLHVYSSTCLLPTTAEVCSSIAMAISLEPCYFLQYRQLLVTELNMLLIISFLKWY